MNNTTLFRAKCVWLLLFFLLSIPLMAQNQEISGVVFDENKEAVIGAAVRVEGIDVGTVTDMDGKFTLKVPVEGTVRISYMGYNTYHLKLTGATSYMVYLVPDVKNLDEIVVVGYGTQKKVNMTGSVSTVNFGTEMSSRPIMQSSNALAGLAAGVSVVQSTGKPGSDGSTIRIRGVGTLNSNTPLVLVDGVEFSLDNLNPNDIESISILKDAASTAIYGSRAANGVILVTTKKGSGKTKITYNGYFTLQNPVNKLELVSNYADLMELVNEAAYNVGKTAIYSQSAIDRWRAAEADPYGLNEYGVENWKAYPNTDWFSEIFNRGLVQQHNLSISGGKPDEMNYYLSVGYLGNEGIMNQRGFDSSQKKYSIRSKLETTLFKHLTVGCNLYGQLSKLGLSNVDGAFNYLDKTVPGIYPGDGEGYFGQPANPEESTNANNIFEQMTGMEGYSDTYNVNGTLFAKLKIIEGLYLEGDYTYTIYRSDVEKWGQPKIKWNYTENKLVSETPSSERGVSQSVGRSKRSDANALIRYNSVFIERHDFSVLAGYSLSHYETQTFGAGKNGMSSYDLHTFDTVEEVISATGSASEWALVSFFGRTNYIYDSRYIFEANVRYDGSSRFSPSHRWGLFPSFSAGWRISEERFMKQFNWLSNLKIRASWGKTGNNASGNYDWQSLYRTNKVTVEGETGTGFYISKIGNNALEWESTTSTNVGLDVGIFNNRLTLEADFYNKNTDGILYTPSLYMTMGTVSGSTENIASVNNKGVEFQLNWQDKIGNFEYKIGGNFAFNKNVVTKYKGKLDRHWVYDENGNVVDYYTNIGEVSQSGFGGRILEGHMLGETYLRKVYSGTGAGYDGSTLDINAGPKDGMIRTDADYRWVSQMVKAGYTFNGSTDVGPDGLYYGDFIYADLDGDGDYGDGDDFYLSGHSYTPKYNFGVNLSLAWKGLDFYMLWQGQAGHYLYWHHNRYNGTAVSYGHSFAKSVAYDHYTFENQDAYYPRLTLDSEMSNGSTSNFWEYKGNWAKLKNVQIGYTFPQKWTKKFFVNDLRLYVSGENLLTITKYPGLDPEMGTDITYPLVKQWAFGIQITL